MVARGFTGSETIVRDAVAKWRKGWIPPVTTAVRLPSVSRVRRWLMPWRIIRDEENYASRFISLMCEKEPELKIAQQLVHSGPRKRFSRISARGGGDGS